MLNPDQILTALHWRYAVKRFDPQKKITPELWKACEEFLRLAPSSFGLQPWKFIVVQDPALRKRLRASTWNQSQVEDCSHFVVVAARKTMDEKHIDRHIQRIVEVRGVSPESLAAYRQGMIDRLLHGRRSTTLEFWAQRQSYIAMGQLMACCALLEVDTCPIEGLEPAEYDEVLGLKDSEWATIACVACGYRAQDDKYAEAKKVRFQKDQVFDHR